MLSHNYYVFFWIYCYCELFTCFWWAFLQADNTDRQSDYNDDREKRKGAKCDCWIHVICNTTEMSHIGETVSVFIHGEAK